ncbi:hypothetical protein CYMTET_34683 [Cymbomonas tetramitiformis]|uniref:HTH OST-type domain-containing protein n=1 Tax=Cymbomonas tetramitiformis TaxID=36881 RepID=A0AAE0FAG8_9CHLO|nr:hypothetical protein CYMTET_34683 [Cymbomonas tetramitiformis]
MFLIDNFVRVLEKHPEGIHLSRFRQVYEEELGETLPRTNEFGYPKLISILRAMKGYARLNEARKKVYPTKFPWMSVEDVEFKELLRTKQKLSCALFSAEEKTEIFEATKKYTLEYLVTWDARYLRRGKLLTNFAQEYAMMHGLQLSSKHCGFKRTHQLIEAMPGLVTLQKNSRNTRLSRIYMAPEVERLCIREQRE